MKIPKGIIFVINLIINKIKRKENQFGTYEYNR